MTFEVDPDDPPSLGVEALTKVCRTCGQEKPLTRFYRRNDTRDRRSGECSACTRDRVDKHKQDYIAEHGIEAWKQKHRNNVRASRARTGNAAGKDYERRKWSVLRLLMERHRKEFDHLMVLAERGELPDD